MARFEALLGSLDNLEVDKFTFAWSADNLVNALRLETMTLLASNQLVISEHLLDCGLASVLGFRYHKCNKYGCQNYGQNLTTYMATKSPDTRSHRSLFRYTRTYL